MTNAMTIDAFWDWVRTSSATAHRGLVVHAALEHAPFVKQGGLGDMVAALSKQLAREGFPSVVLCPWVPELDLPDTRVFRAGFRLWTLDVALEIHAALRDGVICAFVAVDQVLGFRRAYSDGVGLYEADVGLRHFALAKAISVLLAWADDFVLVTHDWHVGAVYLYRRVLTRCRKTVHVIHNYHYCGRIYPDIVPAVEPEVRKQLLESFDDTGLSSLSKLAITGADAVVTVSRSYAEELRSGRAPHVLMEPIMERRDLVGITNGIDESAWTPASSPHLAARYDSSDLAGKALCKARLCDKLRLAVDGRPLVLMMSRLTAQKGIDLLIDLRIGHRFDPADRLRAMLALGLQLVVCGVPQGGLRGPIHLQLQDLAHRCPDDFRYLPGYSDPLAHELLAGADLLLHPSRFEPCGLTQMYALAFGTIPIVTPVGGLKDTVRCARREPSKGFGFHMERYGHDALLDALRDAVTAYRAPATWRAMIARAMAQHNDWSQRVGDYVRLLDA
jgi:starch synthase